MKKLITGTILLMLIFFHFNSFAQEKYGRTLNLALGIGYYGYVGRSLPVFHINYEIDVVKNFTLAPFLSFYTFSGNHSAYAYKETVVPVGVKGTYYFDDLLKANDKWDFYAAGTLGVDIVNSHWDEDYNGDKNYNHRGNPLFLDIHIGSEYHFTNKIGMFLDLSTGVSTVGLAIHGIK